MGWISAIFGTAGLVSLVPALWKLRGHLAGTTLRTAWNWAAGGMLLWGVAWTASLLDPAIPAGIADQLWYAAALVLLCAPIAVLGAKRPGARVWAWFILFPLLLVLGWPAWFAWREGWPPRDLVLVEPAFWAFVAVSIMGVGNYLGTRWAFSALLFELALLCVVAPLSAYRWNWLPGQELGRILGTFSLIAAVWIPRLTAPPRPVGAHGLELVWWDFRDWFGIVWSRRLLERFNEMCRQSRLPVRLELEGFWYRDSAGDPSATPADAGSPPTAHPSERYGLPAAPEVCAGMERTLRWLLRRFVDPEWIDLRMTRSDQAPAADPDSGADRQEVHLQKRELM